MGEGGFSDWHARAVVTQWLEQGLVFDGLFAGDDGAAAGALLALREGKRRVPEDVSVVGFDDLPIATLVDPPLTTVRAPIQEAGRVAAKLLIQQIQGRGTPRSAVLPSQVIIRKSCGCV